MRTVGAVAQAVDTVAFKRAVHIIEGVTDDDARIEQLLRSAQATVETATRRPMTARDVVIEARGKALARWWFPVCPVVSVAAVSLQAGDGTFAALDASAWRIDRAGDEPHLVFADGWFDGAAHAALIRIDARVGHEGGASWPAQLTEAVIMLGKEWLDAGIAMEQGQAAPPVSFGARALMRQVRYARPMEWDV